MSWRCMLRLRHAALMLVLCLGCGDDDLPEPMPDAGALPQDAGSAEDDAGPRPPPFEGPTGLSTGCGSAATAGVEEESIDAAGMERTYFLAVPEGYDPEVGHALIFVFHGAGDSARNMSRLEFEAEAAGEAIVVYPQGGPVLAGSSGWLLDDGTVDTDFFDALLASMEERFCIDRARVFAAGFSYGGFFSNLLGCARGDVVRAIAPVAAGAPSVGCRGQAAAWMAHGSADEVVPFAAGNTARRRWSSRNGCAVEANPATPSFCGSHVGCDEGYPVHFCEHDGGHTWPTWARGAIWEFFSSLP